MTQDVICFQIERCMPMVSVMTCGALTPNICGESAYFRYTGLVHVKSGETYIHAIMRRGRTVVDLCMEHSRDVFINMEPALKDGSAQMRCLVQTKLTLHCTACQSLFRFEPLRPTVVKRASTASMHNGYTLIPNHFCPNCGSPATAEFNPALDYWEVLSNSLNLDMQDTQQIYSLFLADKTATSKFVDYVTSIMKELDDEA